MSTEVARILRDAAALVEPLGRWTKGAQARDELGRPVRPLSTEARCWCMVGAVRRVVGSDDQLMQKALCQLWVVLGNPGSFNDAQDSAEPVVARLLKVACDAEAS